MEPLKCLLSSQEPKPSRRRRPPALRSAGDLVAGGAAPGAAHSATAIAGAPQTPDVQLRQHQFVAFYAGLYRK